MALLRCIRLLHFSLPALLRLFHVAVLHPELAPSRLSVDLSLSLSLSVYFHFDIGILLDSAALVARRVCCVVFAFLSGSVVSPAIRSLPRDIRVTLMRDLPNPLAIYSSKAIGEPPVVLGGSAFFAVKNAIAACRSSSAHVHSSNFVFNSPATVERIRMSCVDDITRLAVESVNPADFQPVSNV
jgi:hypothetical protein